MPRRPSITSRQTASTIISKYSYASSTEHHTDSTALTTPDLSSSKKETGILEGMMDVYEERSTASAETGSRIGRRDVDVVRGPSVRQRASQFEQSRHAEASSSRLPSTMSRTRSTSPLRINKRPLPSPAITPAKSRRVPVPATAPPASEHSYRTTDPPSPTPARRRSPPKLNRNQGSTRKMVEQWESLPNTPGGQRQRLSSNTYDRTYLDQKPLPLPRAGPSSTPYASPARGYPASPNRTSYTASPLQHLQTPDKRGASSMTNSPSVWSLSPSGEKRRKGGRSPLKEMLQVFGGGIQALGRKGKGKAKDRGWIKSSPSTGYDADLERMGSNGLPGGIVFRDRMGDDEMTPKGVGDPNVIRTSAVMYLTPTPCSSLSQWGSWLPSWASLTSTVLAVTYCPIFQDPQAGANTPKRVFSGTNPNKSMDPAVPYSTIPPPVPGALIDVELSMTDCVEVRSLRRDEVKGRGIPAVPGGVGTEVLEMVWSDGTKRYIGVEGVAGRLGWVSAIWDVLLACKTSFPPALPPLSPTASPRHSMAIIPPALGTNDQYPFPLQPPEGFRERPRRSSSGTVVPGPSSAPPVQKIGDRWIAASVIGGSEAGSTKKRGPNAHDLRDSVQRMFETGPDTPPVQASPAASRRDSGNDLPAPLWQPVTERELSIFSRANSKRSEAASRPVTFSEVDRANVPNRADTMLSFDPDDLNPSRSASQVRRPSPGRMRKLPRTDNLAVVEEGSDTYPATTVLRAPTHISHVTFPKPAVGGMPLAPLPLGTKVGGLEMIPSETNSSVETGDSSSLKTPRTAQTTFTAASSLDHTVLAKLTDHSTEHGSLSKQIDNVQVDLRHVITSLTALVRLTQSTDPGNKLDTIQQDVKAIENALNLNSLSTSRLEQAGVPKEEEKLNEIHSKLDAIAKLCEDVLAKSQSSTTTGGAIPIVMSGSGAQRPSSAKIKSPTLGGTKNTLGVTVDSDEEKDAGDEVAQIMAELTGGSNKASPRLGGLQVLHNISAPSSPRPSAPSSPVVGMKLPAAISDDTKQQVGEVLGLVKELKEARTLQTQQTTDIARYLNELNTWLEKFVHNSTNEIQSMSKRLTAIVGSDPDAAEGEKTIGMPDLVADMHSMLTEQKQSAIGQRLDGLLAMMGQEQERHQSQLGLVEQVMGVLEKQRGDNEMLLRALATDLTTEIRGERLRFVEAMQQATSMNITMHVEEFKKLLGTEVNKSMKELGQLREERKALEHQISDLFALKAKHGGRDSRKSSSKHGPPTVSAPPQQGLAPPSPGYGGRFLPSPPGR